MEVNAVRERVANLGGNDVGRTRFSFRANGVAFHFGNRMVTKTL